MSSTRLTFTCRVIAGTGTDMYSAIAGGIGELRGPKHGGAKRSGAFEVQKLRHPDEARPTSARVRRSRSSSASVTRSTP